ncbi:tail fiber assembly protein [Enterobacter ludwigii]|uniref:tail fiber assembly protein n=1 Tax=Enterobacter ludwigii TaxID=299767 RepID=UPI00123A255D|nr:tail fiber assembly protein [Enterobacter ludwigii]
MRKLFFNPENTGFYDTQYNSVIPDGSVEITQDIYDEFAGVAWPEGKVIGGNDAGMPAWVDEPPQTEEELIAEAESQKAQLRAAADSEIEWRQDAVDAEIATEEETAALAEWKKYRVLLMRVDTEDPDWPTPPEQQAS